MIEVNWEEFRPIVSFANRLPCPPGFSFGPRIIFDHQFIFVSEGKGTAQIGDRCYEAAAGDLFYYGPEIIHRFQADTREPFVLYGLHFSLNRTLPETGVALFSSTQNVDPSLYGQMRENALVLGSGLEAEQLIVPECCRPGIAWMEPYFRGVAETFIQMPSKLVHLRNRLLLTQFLLELQQWLQRSGSEEGRSTGLMLEVRAKLSQCADQPYTRSWLEQWTSYHENHAARLFQQAFGLPPHDYFLQQKIARAKELLLSSDIAIGEIADRLNAGSIHYFSRMFKKHTGVSPVEFRKTRRFI